MSNSPGKSPSASASSRCSCGWISADDSALRSGRFDTINTGLFWTEELQRCCTSCPDAQQRSHLYRSFSSLKLESSKISPAASSASSGDLYRAQGARVQRRYVAKGVKEIELRTFTTVTATSRPCAPGSSRRAQHQRDRQLPRNSSGIPRSGSGHCRHRHHLRLPRQSAWRRHADALTRSAQTAPRQLFDKFGMTKLKPPLSSSAATVYQLTARAAAFAAALHCGDDPMTGAA